MWEEEGTTNCESGGDQSKKIDLVNVSLQSCRKIGWKIKIGILEGGIGFLWLLKRPPPPSWGGDFKVCKMQRTQRWPIFGRELVQPLPRSRRQEEHKKHARIPLEAPEPLFLTLSSSQSTLQGLRTVVFDNFFHPSP